MLVAAHRRPVAVERIIDAVWDDNAPSGARASVHTYISNLRSVLGDVITRGSEGYTLDVAEDTIDAIRFERLHREGVDALESSPHHAATLLRDALDLWRGHAYADVDVREALDTEIARLGEIRLVTLSARIEADLALGSHAELVGELEALTGEYPFQERFRAQQMVALYRSGRQAEALRVYDRTRRHLVDELGIEPTPKLQELERQILDHDSSLDLEVTAAVQHRTLLVADIGPAAELALLSAADRGGLLSTVGAAIDGAVVNAGGQIFAQRGSALYASFTEVGAAVAAAEMTHRATDGIGPIAGARIAIEVGDVEVGPGGEISGPVVVRVASLVSAAHPGQVLLSDEAHDGLVSADVAGWQVRALGSHQLAGLEQRRIVYQLLLDGQDSPFPPLLADAVPPPQPTTPRGMYGYELRERIRTWEFGETYRAYQPSVGREVAIEVIGPAIANEPAFVRRFETEAQLVARLEHPNIVAIDDYWREPDHAYLVTRWLRGGSLESFLIAGRIEPAAAASMVVGLASALDTAHRNGVVHRGIRPATILLDDDANAYLADFGVALELGTAYNRRRHAASAGGLAYRAPEARAGSGGSEASDIYALGAVLHELLVGEAPPLDGRPDGLAIDGPLSEVVARAIASEPADRFGSAADLGLAIQDAVGASGSLLPVRTTAPNPYRGLAAFSEADSGDFHGRDGLIEQILQGMERSRLLAVVGPSGSGKSSAVRAGVVPALRSGAIDGSADWFITDMVPGAEPYEELASALLRIATSSAADLDADIRRDTRGIVRTTRRLLPDGADALLVIDQLEELFTLADERTASAFLDALTTVVTDSRSRLKVLVTIRADFFDHPLRHPALGAILRSSTVPVGPPTEHELRQIIEEPARRRGIEFEPGLTDRIIADFTEEPGGLPLLEYALTDVFDRRAVDVMSSTDYNGIGGVGGALGQRADATFVELDESARIATRQIFLRLAGVHSSRHTRRRVRRSELEQLSISPVATAAALTAFGEARLLTFDRDAATRGSTVEVAHEALFAEWSRLSSWIDDRGADLVLAQRLAASTDDWVMADRSDDYLLTGGVLAQHEEWTADTDLTLTSPERELLDTSRGHAEQRRLTVRRRRIAVLAGFAIVAIAAAALAVVAVVARGDAQREARLATSRGLVSASAASLEGDPERSLLLAIVAAETSLDAGEPFERGAIEALHASLGAMRVTGRFDAGGSVAVSSDGSQVVMTRVAENVEVLVADGGTGETIREFATSDVLAFNNVLALSPDDRAVALTTEAGELIVIELETGIELARMSGRAWNWPTFGPDGRLLLVVNSDGTASVWDWNAGRETLAFELGSEGAGASFSPDGVHVALGIRDGGGVQVFDGSTGAPVAFAEGHVGPITGVAYSPDGSRLASASGVPSMVLVSDPMDGSTLALFPSPIEAVESLGWSPDGTRMALGGNGGEVVIVDVASGDELMRLKGAQGNVFSLDWFPDGKQVAAVGWPNGTVTWDATAGNESNGALSEAPRGTGFGGVWYGRTETDAVLPSIFGGISLVDLGSGSVEAQTITENTYVDWPGLPVVSPGGSLVAMSDTSGVLTIYDTATMSPLRSVEGLYPIGSFSPDGRTLVVAPRRAPDQTSGPATAGLLDVETGELLFEFAEMNVPIRNGVLAAHAAFAPGGQYVAITGPVRVYDATSGELVFAPDRFANAVAFSPSGTRLAIISQTGEADLYDFEAVLAGADEDGALLRSWQAVDANGLFLAWTPDGETLLTGGMDERITAYDSDGSETRFAIPVGPVAGVDLSEDGSRALVGGLSGPRIVVLDPGELLAFARSRITRGLTVEECASFLPGRSCPTFGEMASTSVP